MNTDYHIWMTGTLPGNMRFHLLNSDDNDALLLHIWYKNPQRKDVYKVRLNVLIKNHLCFSSFFVHSSIYVMMLFLL